MPMRATGPFNEYVSHMSMSHAHPQAQHVTETGNYQIGEAPIVPSTPMAFAPQSTLGLAVDDFKTAFEDFYRDDPDIREAFNKACEGHLDGITTEHEFMEQMARFVCATKCEDITDLYLDILSPDLK